MCENIQSAESAVLRAELKLWQIDKFKPCPTDGIEKKPDFLSKHQAIVLTSGLTSLLLFCLHFRQIIKKVSEKVKKIVKNHRLTSFEKALFG